MGLVSDVRLAIKIWEISNLESTRCGIGWVGTLQETDVPKSYELLNSTVTRRATSP